MGLGFLVAQAPVQRAAQLFSGCASQRAVEWMVWELPLISWDSPDKRSASVAYLLE